MRATSSKTRTLLDIKTRASNLAAASSRPDNTAVRVSDTDWQRLGDAPRADLLDLGFRVEGGVATEGEQTTARRYYLTVGERAYELVH